MLSQMLLASSLVPSNAGISSSVVAPVGRDITVTAGLFLICDPLVGARIEPGFFGDLVVPVLWRNLIRRWWIELRLLRPTGHTAHHVVT